MTAIEWTDVTSPRGRASAAARIGATLVEYDARRAAREKWCGRCRAWQPVDDFGRDVSRSDGRTSSCRTSKNTRARETHEPAPPRKTGASRVVARSGDCRQARRRVNYLVDLGRLPRPNTLPCADCGHQWTAGERRHEYDHHLGYEPEHHEDVEPVCTSCHHLREIARRAV